MRRWLAAAALLLSVEAGAVLPGEELPDPVQEARAREISKQLRCVVCQNQSIDDSDAPLAADLRMIVRERIAAGATDDEAIEHVVDRYGSYVLLKPPMTAATLGLWLGPLAVLLIGGAGVARYLWKRRLPQAGAALSDDEAARVETLLKDAR